MFFTLYCELNIGKLDQQISAFCFIYILHIVLTVFELGLYNVEFHEFVK